MVALSRSDIEYTDNDIESNVVNSIFTPELDRDRYSTSEEFESPCFLAELHNLDDLLNGYLIRFNSGDELKDIEVAKDKISLSLKVIALRVINDDEKYIATMSICYSYFQIYSNSNPVIMKEISSVFTKIMQEFHPVTMKSSLSL
ncbi:MAG: hypothetical protein Q9M91_04370 [Candidatus Dojkabacteria bacterium]|nr:hypothetical protein [Candidatus Dojkabacteria bacterium]MDQ7021047.1 hypothetical protein [Candidatus Dojkabacteria bacterium]